MLIAELILELTATATGVSVRKIKSDAQDKDITDARKIAVALMLEHNCSNSTVARHIKYKDRSGVSKAFEQHKNMMLEATNFSNYVITFRRAQACTKKAVEMLMNDTDIPVQQIVQIVGKKC